MESQRRGSKGSIITKASISTTSLPSAMVKRVKRVSFCEDVEEMVTTASDGEISIVKVLESIAVDRQNKWARQCIPTPRKRKSHEDSLES